MADAVSERQSARLIATVRGGIDVRWSDFRKRPSGRVGGYKFTIEKTEQGHEVQKPLGERNPKWLNDDYVKFIRFAQLKMDAMEEGIVGIITNHSWLDNPTFRGMRQSLMRTFQQIYVLDLHGNTKKKERSSDGSKDENVFDIEQGVAQVRERVRGRRLSVHVLEHQTPDPGVVGNSRRRWNVCLGDFANGNRDGQ